MLNRYRQTGAFLLVTIVFLMAAGGAMLYAMANLSTVTSTSATVAHNNNQALLAAQSGLKYCLMQTINCPNALGPTRNITGIACTVEVTDANCAAGAATKVCTYTSRAYCPNATDPYRGAKKLSIQVQKTPGTGAYQIIPASRQVLPLP